MASICGRIAAKLGLSIPMVLLMFKGAIAPRIGLAIYQSDAVARRFSTIDYLIPIILILTILVAPRARFFQNLIVAMLSVGLAVALSFLSMWCAVRARANASHIPPMGNTAGPVAGAHVSPYNAAASANMAIWLSFEVWLANTFRAFRPQYFLPSIIFSTFIQVTATYRTLFATIDEVGSLIKRLVETFFAGFGLAAAVNVVIIPLTSRKLVSMHMTETINAIRGTLDAQREFTQSLSSGDWLFVHDKLDLSQQEARSSWTEANILKTKIMEAAIALGKVTSELRYAKREIGWGYLGPKELANIARLLRKVLASILWMESLVEATGQTPRIMTEVESITRKEEQQKWCWLLQQRHGPTEQLIQTMKEGLDHSVYILLLGKVPAVSQSDIEANRDHTSMHLKEMIEIFLQERQGSLETWFSWTGMRQSSEMPKGVNSQQCERYLFQLYFFLDLESSLIATARRILDLVKYADLKANDGTRHRKRLVLPTWKQIKKWSWAALCRED